MSVEGNSLELLKKDSEHLSDQEFQDLVIHLLLEIKGMLESLLKAIYEY